jgi:hypothetical protein
MMTRSIRPAFMLALALAAPLSAGEGRAQIIAPGQTGQDLPQVPSFKPSRPLGADPLGIDPPNADRSWTLRRGKRGPPPRWERENGFANPPAYGGPRDARPRSPYVEDR